MTEFTTEELQLLYHACEDAKMLTERGLTDPEADEEDRENLESIFVRYQELTEKLGSMLMERNAGA